MEEIVQETRTLRGQVLQKLRLALVSGDPAPGARLNEVQLATRLGVSRGTIREAVRNLEQEGLLTTIPHKGTFVRALTPEEAVHVYEVRFALENCAAASAAKRLTPELREMMRERLEAIERAEATGAPFSERLDADLRFHEAICKTSGNAILLTQWRSMIGLIAAVMHSVGSEQLRPLQSPAMHRGLLDAVESGDEEQIRRVWQAHFEYGARQISEALRHGLQTGKVESDAAVI